MNRFPHLLALGILCFSAVCLELQAQDSKQGCVADQWHSVSTPSGVKLRSAPNLKASTVALIPRDSSLLLCPEKFGDLAVEGVQGSWRFAQYRNHEGFVFDGFLRARFSEGVPKDSLSVSDTASQSKTPILQHPGKVESPMEFKVIGAVYNHCGSIDSLDPAWFWYGLYADGEQEPIRYQLRPVELLISLSPGSKPGKPEFDILPKNQEPPALLIGGNRPIAALSADELHSGQRFPLALMPGTVSTLPAPGALHSLDIKLLALGSIDEVGDCPSIKNYRLEIEQSGLRQSLSDIFQLEDRCGAPELFWFGDLNSDRIPDAVFIEKTSDKVRFTLLNSQSRPQQIWTVGSRWIYQNCP